MKKVILLMVALGAGFALFAQEESGRDAEYYNKQYAKLYKQYVKDPENVASNIIMADFFADTLNPMCNLATAMKHINAAEEHYIAIVEDRDKYREVSKLIKRKITLTSVRQKKQLVMRMAKHELTSEKLLSDAILDSYTEVFKKEPSMQRLVEQKRLQVRYHQAVEADNLEAYREFYKTYPNTIEGENAAKQMYRIAYAKVEHATRESQVDSLLSGYLDISDVQRAAADRKSALAYAALMQNPSPQGYRDFLKKYLGSNEYTLVLEKVEGLLDDEFAHLSTPRQYADFAIKNPDNPLAEKAIGEIKRMITVERNTSAFDIYMKEFPLDINYNDIYLQYYNWHIEEGNRAPIDRFVEQHPDFPYKMAVQDALVQADKIDSIDINKPFNEKDFKAWSSKIYHLTGKKVSFVALQRTLQQLIAAKKWNKIPERLDFFSLSFEDICLDEVAELRAIVNAPANKKIVLTPVVRPSYDMEHPVMHPDGKHIYYNRNVNGVMAICVAELTATKKSAVWKGLGEITFTDIANQNLQVFSIFDNGRKMIIGQNGDLLIAEISDEGWHIIERPDAPVNSEYMEFDACMLPDGSGMLFASDRPGGYNLQPSRAYFHGDTALASDIYFAPRTDNGWGEPVNLGIGVNSPYMECSPAISNDLKTLYFVTDGRGGLGYGDIYYTTRDNTDDWCHWSKPTNCGKEINTGFNEASVTLADNQRKLIISSNSHGRYGCYNAAANHTVNDDFKTVSVKTAGVGIVFDIVDIATQKPVNSNQTVERESSWQGNFYVGKQYAFYPYCEGLFIPGSLFSTSSDITLKPVAYTADSLVLLSASSIELPLPAIVFDSNSAVIKTSSLYELGHLANFLQRNPSTSIELVVDVDGSDDIACFDLSQRRGQATRDALVSNGINADRIIISAYGNSRSKRNGNISSVSMMLHTF